MSTYTQGTSRTDLVEASSTGKPPCACFPCPRTRSASRCTSTTLQAKVSWTDRIVLPLGRPICTSCRQAKTKKWVTKCDCGHEFGDYRENWKLARLHLRARHRRGDDRGLSQADGAGHQWQVYREYYCPKCGTMHDVEAPTPWYPVIHDFEPDIDAFYKEWVHLPVARARLSASRLSAGRYGRR